MIFYTLRDRESKLVLQGQSDSIVLTLYFQRLIFLFHLKLPPTLSWFDSMQPAATAHSNLEDVKLPINPAMVSIKKASEQP